MQLKERSMSELERYDIQSKQVISLWDADQSNQNIEVDAEKVVGSGNIFDSHHYIPDSFFGASAIPSNTE